MHTRKQIIESVKKHNNKIAAIFPIHYPKELFKAFNIHPIEVWGPPGMDSTTAKSHLQSYICSVIQSGLSFYLQGGLDIADMIVVPHCCDSLQGLGSILKDFTKQNKPIFTLYIPREQRKSDIDFLKREIKNLFQSIAKMVGYAPSTNEIVRAIEKEEEIDKLLLKAYEIHTKYGTNSYEFYTIIRSREYLTNNLFEKSLKKFINNKHTKSSAKPVVFSGVLPEPMNLLEFIDKIGGVVIDDDFACTKRRIYTAGTSSEPFERMAERIVYSPPDSMKGSSIKARFNFLKNIVEQSQAKGVIFHNIKFCEPENFYHPLLKEHLKNSGVSTLNIEVDINEPLSQSIKIRIQAFLESITQE